MALLTPKEVAAQLSVGIRTVQRLCAEKEIRFVRVRSELRFQQEWVDEYIAAQTVAPSSEQITTLEKQRKKSRQVAATIPGHYPTLAKAMGKRKTARR